MFCVRAPASAHLHLCGKVRCLKQLFSETHGVREVYGTRYTLYSFTFCKKGRRFQREIIFHEKVTPSLFGPGQWCVRFFKFPLAEPEKIKSSTRQKGAMVRWRHSSRIVCRAGVRPCVWSLMQSCVKSLLFLHFKWSIFEGRGCMYRLGTVSINFIL